MTIDQVASNLSDTSTNIGYDLPWIENSQETTKSISYVL